MKEGEEINGTSTSCAPSSTVAEDSSLSQDMTQLVPAIIIPSDLSKESVHQNDAVPLDNPSSPNIETDMKSSEPSKSSLTESAVSNDSGPPVDEDDAGPFNQSAYQRHLKGGNLCYDTFTLKDSHYYDISQGRKLALILNHEYYNHYDNQNIPRRTGTRKVCSDAFIKFKYKRVL